MTRRPRLVTVAHGTRKSGGNEVARQITLAAGLALGVEAVCSYVELSDPLFEDVVAADVTPTVVVPLLLSTGFHLRQDLPRMASAAAGPLVLGRPLGPHRLVAQAQLEQLARVGARPGDGRLVLVAAGSSDPLATRDLTRAAELLGRSWGSAVEVATLSALGRRPAEVVRAGDVVSPYLLSPGFFADRARDESLAAGAAVIADVIGPHPLVVDLVVQRAHALESVRQTA
ncbi:cobalamin biosynthesis protein CbiX [Nocardioides psychrotolerans]|uniref:Sirohydrochlorin ferrochelatase n=1 Tax=Nocardioides psychrotolerans TaxID=1005945 RepID=A0A1I3DUJ2_9ACTN|nr:sirohydrochlorin chelatase [Nocardioides psychrotolerans]GEP39245.1 cobalamin biosynthesis protein CbiX [Nocardioides psychrotolerans]SFH90313.1 Sirohydrochlorin ferrochelatase [Nocardioides psychrotolerans]